MGGGRATPRKERATAAGYRPTRTMGAGPSATSEQNAERYLETAYRYIYIEREIRT